MQGEGELLVGLGSGGADLKEFGVSVICGRGLEKRGGEAGGQGSKMLGREGVAGIDRM